MPEELNRIVADSVSAYLFAPTAAAVGNLVAEGHVVVADGALVVEGSEAGIWRTEARPAGPAIAVGHAGAGDEAAPGDAREARGGRLEAGVRQTAASGVEPPASVRELGGAAASAARGRIYRTGDIMYDALLLQAPAAAARSPIIDELSLAPRGYALATVHRAANTDDPARLERLLDALASLGEPVVLPMHPRTRAALAHSDIEVGAAVRVIDPVGYRDMLALEQQARVILTDSGGVQKEAYLLGVPCVTLRDETEWTETLADGWNILAGDAPERILAAARRPRPEREPAPVFGDGHAAERMLAAIEAR
ncbi:MAG: UDP-N-acetylglucosamine 2-epimerase [Dehalococcoidia bacterium]|nr:UDP-N-acetylglucosamine 2-epimerase [Dehalococcoidia bacterium]